MLALDDQLSRNDTYHNEELCILDILQQLESDVDLGLEIPDSPILTSTSTSTSQPESSLASLPGSSSAGTSPPIPTLDGEPLDLLSDLQVRGDSELYSGLTPLFHRVGSSKRHRFSIDGANLEALSDIEIFAKQQSPGWRHSSAPTSSRPGFSSHKDGLPQRSRVVYHGQRYSRTLRRSSTRRHVPVDTGDSSKESEQLDFSSNDETNPTNQNRASRQILPRLVIPHNSRRRAIEMSQAANKGSPSTPVLEKSAILPKIPSRRVVMKDGTVDASYDAGRITQEASAGSDIVSQTRLPSNATPRSTQSGKSHMAFGETIADYYSASSSSTRYSYQRRERYYQSDDVEDPDSSAYSPGLGANSDMFKKVLHILRRTESQRKSRPLLKKHGTRKAEKPAPPQPVSPLSEVPSPFSSTHSPISSTTSISRQQSTRLGQEFRPNFRSCKVCGDLFDVNAIPRSPSSQCIHDRTICRDCTLKWVQTSLQDRGAGSIHCPSPSCSENLAYDEIRNLGNAETLEA